MIIFMIHIIHARGQKYVFRANKKRIRMNQSNGKVDALKKVTLLLEAGGREGKMDLTPEPFSFEFVVGVEPEGYTPFEYELMEKKVGDILRLEIQGWRFDEMFGRLGVPLPEGMKAMDVFFLKVTVSDVEDADQTDIIRAMAGRVGDCGGGCCGNH
jgi:hypothetical protein